MKTQINLPAAALADLMQHLLPPDARREEGAFVFAAPQKSDGQLCFRFIEAVKLCPADYAAQYSDYLELTDEARARLIKRAHDLDASIVEIHSHLGPWRASFSYSDIAGLKETVPHMWWRLRGRPYAALVFARDGFDALVWSDNPDKPVALDGLVAGDRVLKPTNSTLEEWI